MNWGNVAICAACFAAGAGLASYKGSAELAEARLAAAIERANTGRDYYDKLVSAQDALSEANAQRVDLRAELERVRKSYALRTGNKAVTGNVACPSNARCEELLRESTELLAGCADLLQRNAAQHDALANALK